MAHNGQYTCPRKGCEAKTDTFESLSEHYYSAHTVYGELCSCPVCAACFEHQSELETHQRWDHLEEPLTAKGDRILRLLRENGMGNVAPAILQSVQYCIRMKAKPTEEAQLESGASKLGGNPDLPPGCTWPTWDGAPLSFVAQIRMDDVAQLDDEGELPSSGILYVFYDADEDAEVSDDDFDAWKMIYEPKPVSLARREPPSSLEVFTPCSIAWARELTLAPWYAFDFGSERNEGVYMELLDRLAVAQGGDRPIHQLLGHPFAIQDYDMAALCSDCLRDLIEEEPEFAKRTKVRSENDWRLLLQLDSDEELGTQWGDFGLIYFWIRRSDLAKRIFDWVWSFQVCH